MKTPIECIIRNLQEKHDGFLGVHGEEARQNFKSGIAWSISSADSYLQEEKRILEMLKQVTFTANKLWDEVKPIKDGWAMTVTHPTIEEARVMLEEYNIKLPTK